MEKFEDVDKKTRDPAVLIVEQATSTERSLLNAWGRSLLEIKNSELSFYEKAKQSITLTANSPAQVPVVKMVGNELVRIGWTDRVVPARFALGGVVAALTLTGSGAGIAAFGGAIGVPLWIVFGAGAAFFGTIVDEVSKKDKDKVD